jgi:hypothetical protein
MTRLQNFTDIARRCYYLYTRSAKHNGNVREVPVGWCKLGSGYYGVALRHVDYPEYCLKISGRAGWGYNYATSVQDDSRRLDAWPVFAEHCKNNPHEHLPEILHFARVSEAMTWAIMPTYIDYGEHYARYANHRINEIHMMLDGQIDCTEPWLWPLRQMANGMYMEVDLHDGNVMHNPKTNTFVIIDPFSTTGDTQCTN